jgi:hypothetical protein
MRSSSPALEAQQVAAEEEHVAGEHVGDWTSARRCRGGARRREGEALPPPGAAPPPRSARKIGWRERNGVGWGREIFLATCSTVFLLYPDTKASRIFLVSEPVTRRNNKHWGKAILISNIADGGWGTGRYLRL